MYFVHSFYANPENHEHSFATSSFGDLNFCSVVHKENAWGMQFHPEKSGQTGLNMLKGFLKA
jgi:glutamine amidotransferase